MKKSNKWKLLGNVWVDSAEVFITDPCYLDRELPKIGVLVTPVDGDGVYPVFVRMEGKRVLELRISFEEQMDV